MKEKNTIKIIFQDQDYKKNEIILFINSNMSLISKTLSGTNRLQNIILSDTQLENTITKISSNSVDIGAINNPFNNLYVNNINTGANIYSQVSNSFGSLITSINTEFQNLNDNILYEVNITNANINSSISNLFNHFTAPLFKTSGNIALNYDNHTIVLNSAGSLSTKVHELVKAFGPLHSKNWGEYLEFIGIDILICP